VCKGVEKQGIGNRDQGIENRLHLAEKCTAGKRTLGEEDEWGNRCCL
jgi:hypothetical protein